MNVPGSLKQISVGGAGDVWGLNYLQNIYHYNAQTSSWTQVSGQLSQIAVGNSGAVYGLNAAGSIYWYNPGTGYFQYVPGTIGYSQHRGGCGRRSLGRDGRHSLSLRRTARDDGRHQRRRVSRNSASGMERAYLGSILRETCTNSTARRKPGFRSPAISAASPPGRTGQFGVSLRVSRSMSFSARKFVPIRA